MTDQSRPRYEDLTFSAQDDRALSLANLVAEVAQNPSARILDLGCGTGGILAAIADVMPQAHLSGIDISHPNTARAAARLPKAIIVTADYMVASSGTYDIIVTDSVLQFIHCDHDALAARLAEDLAPGGALVFTLPIACRYNQALTFLRRILGALRCAALDRVIFALARMVHGGDYPANLLAERVDYAYILPQRHLSPPFSDALTRHGLIEERRIAQPHRSPAQLIHTLAVFRKT